MVSVGTLEIVGKIDTDDISSSLTNLKKKFATFGSGVKSSFADFKRLGGAVGEVAKGFKIIGTIGLAALTALAMKSPALAPALAGFQVEMFRLSQIIGEDLRPVFEWALDAFSTFIGYMEQHPAVRTFGEVFATIVGSMLLLKGLAWVFSGFGTLINILAGATVSASLFTFFTLVASVLTSIWLLFKLMEALRGPESMQESQSTIFNDSLLRTGHTGTWSPGVTDPDMFTNNNGGQLPTDVTSQLSALTTQWMTAKGTMYFTTNTTGSVGLE